MERCKFSYDKHDEKLVFNIECKKQVQKTFKMNVETYEEDDPMAKVRAVYNIQDCPNVMHVRPKLFSEALLNFSPSVKDMTLETGQSGVRIKSMPNDGSSSELSLQTELKLDPNSFEPGTTFPQELKISFALRDFKAMITLCDVLGQNVTLHIPEPGGAFAIVTKWFTAIEAEFVIATHFDKSMSVAPSAPSSQRSQAPIPPKVSSQFNRELSGHKRNMQEFQERSGSRPEVPQTFPKVKTEKQVPEMAPGSPEVKRRRAEQFDPEENKTNLPLPIGGHLTSEDEEEEPAW